MNSDLDFPELDEYSEDFHQYYYTPEESLADVWNNCVILSISSIIPVLANLILCNLLFGCLLLCGLPETYGHVLTGSLGIYLLSTIESPFGKFILVPCFIFSTLLLVISHKFFKTSNLLKSIFVILLVLCEYFIVEPKLWLQLRGIIMILIMKTISLAEDIEQLQRLPTLFEYFGYTFCGANIMFGPWISFNDYLNLFRKPKQKSFFWILSLFQVVIISVFFLTISNCWSTYFVNESANRWFQAYREAFAFRTSHYFVSYLAEAGMIAAGFSSKSKFRYVITEPLEIEFPSSLAVVVRKWNQPMHNFLKKYIYRSWLPHGRFTAILVTFLMSSLLHGLELKVSVILLSLGTFSYIQVVFRDKIADVFDICVKVRPCKDCKHKYKRSSINVKLSLFVFLFLTVLHLAYLGVLMDSSTDKIGIYEKWQNLYFVSHIVIFFKFMFLL